MASERTKQFSLDFTNLLKNDLYKVAKLEIDSVSKLFYRFKYPNIKSESVNGFIEALILIIDKGLHANESKELELFKIILEDAKKTDLLPFLTNVEDHILIKNFSGFYIRPISLFKNSKHTFDKETVISECLAGYKFVEGDAEIKNYIFVDSQSKLLIQYSDVFIGLIGKLTDYLNTSQMEKIKNDFDSLSNKQKNNIDLLLDLIYKSHNKNIGFLYSIESYEEKSKMLLIGLIRNKLDVVGN